MRQGGTGRAGRLLLPAVLGIAGGFVGAGLWSVSGLGDARTRDYLLANPQLLPQMADALTRAEGEARLEAAGAALQAPFPGAVLGNPDGSRVLVEFTDYACGYCRASVPEVAALIAADPQLKVVVREWPIFPGSEAAARMALAAARQGRYAAFHDALFARGRPTPQSIEAAARSVGLDWERARRDVASPEISAELARNDALARTLGLDGTPGWVAGGQVLRGAVGRGPLAEALAAAQTGAARPAPGR